MKAAFSPLRETPGTLAATLEDGTVRWIRAMPIDMRSSAIVPGAANTSIELIADDPFWYGSDALVMDSGYDMADGETMDSGVSEVVITPDSASYTVTIHSNGTAPVYDAKVTFTGPSTGYTRFEDHANAIGWTGPALAAGEVMVVDSGTRTVTLDGVQARNDLILHADNLNGEYVRLDPGTNPIRITGQPAEVRVRFNSAYL